MNAGKHLDPRLHAYRDDLAAVHLRDQVAVPSYVQGKRFQVCVGVVPLLRVPRPGAFMDTQLLFGETFHVYEEKEGWCWGQAALDGYVGYVCADCLKPFQHEPTHKVTALRTFVYPEPDIKTRPLMALSINARLCVEGLEGSFHVLKEGGFVFASHIAPADTVVADYVGVAERFVGVPYLWGGRSGLGCDCSGLVQLSLEQAGLQALRDTDMQEATLGTALSAHEALHTLCRGDLVFWKGHVGIIPEKNVLLHANATHMSVVQEPLEKAVRRIDCTQGPITALRRFTERVGAQD